MTSFQIITYFMTRSQILKIINTKNVMILSMTNQFFDDTSSRYEHASVLFEAKEIIIQ